ncbi:hypothetical protein [Psychromarinibacter halotolerans]|uniref:Secreted protein n=1 Tax=Psychromarinibacter halotolerans TaxID=1775175 RepID=A0ABV7GQ45_9RHOB|nr:hypothetical protein [Psychromarinibacter halotolerans]MDF0594799.1 hypothetical protein [Psychromarinibacter halotolerans]
MQYLVDKIMPGFPKFLKFIVLASTVAAAPHAASAATMTFDELNSCSEPMQAPCNNLYEEDGITASMTGIVWGPGALPLNDYGDRESKYVDFTMERPFRAVEFKVTRSPNGWVEESPSYTETIANPPLIFPELRITGFTGSSIKFEHLIDSSRTSSSLSFLFPDLPNVITRLRIEHLRPDESGFQAFCPLMGTVPCNSVRIDEVTLAPVPVPASGVLLLSALVLGLGRAGHRRAVAHKRRQ